MQRSSAMPHHFFVTSHSYLERVATVRVNSRHGAVIVPPLPLALYYNTESVKIKQRHPFVLISMRNRRRCSVLVLFLTRCGGVKGVCCVERRRFTLTSSRGISCPFTPRSWPRHTLTLAGWEGAQCRFEPRMSLLSLCRCREKSN